MRRCYKCKDEFPFTDKFFVKSKRNKSGLKTECRKCHNERAREYRKRNKEKLREYNRNRPTRNRESISNEELEELLNKQNYSCAICGYYFDLNNEDNSHILCIDHNHDTTKIRGILCSACNKGLGFFRDNPQLIKKAYKYIMGS